MYDEMVAYIEYRLEELGKEADEAEKNGDVISAKIAIEKMIELRSTEIFMNNLEIENTRKRIDEMIKKREKSA